MLRLIIYMLSLIIYMFKPKIYGQSTYNFSSVML